MRSADRDDLGLPGVPAGREAHRRPFIVIEIATIDGQPIFSHQTASPVAGLRHPLRQHDGEDDEEGGPQLAARRISSSPIQLRSSGGRSA
jgi:hypothetical protein